MASTIPLTVQSSKEPNLSSRIAIGGNLLSLDYTKLNLYWVLVLDRTDASVKENFTFSENDTVPSQLKPYIGDSQYILVVATQLLGSDNLPTGAWHDYLVNEGAGVELLKLEQIFEAFNCSNFGRMSYSYVAIMGDSTSNGFELSNFQDSTALLPLELVPVTFGGKTLYTPMTLGSSGQH